jgi:hypothetical protein
VRQSWQEARACRIRYVAKPCSVFVCAPLWLPPAASVNKSRGRSKGRGVEVLRSLRRPEADRKPSVARRRRRLAFRLLDLSATKLGERTENIYENKRQGQKAHESGRPEARGAVVKGARSRARGRRGRPTARKAPARPELKDGTRYRFSTSGRSPRRRIENRSVPSTYGLLRADERPLNWSLAQCGMTVAAWHPPADRHEFLPAPVWRAWPFPD